MMGRKKGRKWIDEERNGSKIRRKETRPVLQSQGK